MDTIFIFRSSLGMFVVQQQKRGIILKQQGGFIESPNPSQS